MKPYLLNTNKAGSPAAFINAFLAIMALVVAFGFIGPAALTDNSKFVELAITNPLPLITQDLLKFASAIVTTILIVALFYRLHGKSPILAGLAALLGLLAIACLLVNASLSLYAVSQAASFAQAGAELGNQLNNIIGLLAVAVIAINGLWYLLVSWAALKTNQLPRRLNQLGLLIGGLSLLPPLGVIVLFLSIVWSLWLGWALMGR